MAVCNNFVMYWTDIQQIGVAKFWPSDLVHVRVSDEQCIKDEDTKLHECWSVM